MARAELARGSDESAGFGDIGAAIAVREEAVVADASEARRNDMQEESMEELGGREVHRLLRVSVFVVAISKRHAIVVERKDAVVRDSDPVSVGSQIREHLFGSAERRLDVGDPVGLGGAGQQQIESQAVGNDVRRKNQRAGVIGVGDGVLDEGAEAAGESFVMEQERACRDAHPAAAIEREAAAGNDAMDMRVKDQRLTPGVEHREQAEQSAEFRRRDVEQGLARGA